MRFESDGYNHREMNNVYNDPAYAEVVEELKAELRRLKRDLGDTNDRVWQR